MISHSKKSINLCRVKQKQTFNLLFIMPIANCTKPVKRVKSLGLTLLLVAITGLVVGCDKASENSTNNHDDTVNSVDFSHYNDLFSGCYTVTKGLPAQIKISQKKDGMVMQMKEPSSAKRVWDDPEPLIILPISDAVKFFSVDSKHLKGILYRPDELFAIAYLDSAYVNTNPVYDSQYLGKVLQLSNTIYKVKCDEIHSDEIADEAVLNNN